MERDEDDCTYITAGVYAGLLEWFVTHTVSKLWHCKAYGKWPLKKAHEANMRPELQIKDTCASNIHCPVWSWLKNLGKLLGVYSRP